MKIRTYEPASVTLLNGVTLRLKVKTLGLKERGAYERSIERLQRREADRLISARRPGDELARDVASAISPDDLQNYAAVADLFEQALARKEEVSAERVIGTLRTLITAVTPSEGFVLSDDEIQRRRYLEFSDADRKVYERLKQEDQEAYEMCVSEAFEKYVRVEPGQIQHEDVDTGVVTDVVTGAQLLPCLGIDAGAIQDILMAIIAKNKLSAVEKNDSGSPSPSTTSSIERDPTVPGAAPATIADNAGPSGSVMSAVVMPTAASPSGSTAM